MNAHSECFVSGALATVLRLSRFFGIAPLRFKNKGNGWQVSLSSSLSILGHFIVTITNVAIIAVLVFVVQKELRNSIETNNTVDTPDIMRILIITVKLIVVVTLAAIMVYGAPSHMRRLIICTIQIQQINSMLDIHHWPTQCTKKLIALFVIWGAVTLLCSMSEIIFSIIFFLSGTAVWVKVIFVILYTSYWAMQMRLMQHIFLVMHVRSGFTAVNGCLKNLLYDLKQRSKQGVLLRSNAVHKVDKKFKEKTKKNKVKVNNYVNLSTDSGKYYISDNMTRSGSQEIIRRVAIAYASTCDVMRDVDRSQGFTVLIMLIFLFLHLITTAYQFIDNLSYDIFLSLNDTVFVIYELIALVWCVIYTSNLVMIIEPCHLTYVEMETTRKLVSDLMRCTESAYDPLLVELEQFYRQLILNDICYKAFEVTTITRDLLLNILSSLTTYLVIIMKIK